MKERPILFNSEMVQAVLDGRKTQTRRIFKTGKHEVASDIVTNYPRDNVFVFGCDCDECRADNTHQALVKCPHGAINDELWVRETFAIEHNADLQDVYTEPESPLGPVKNIVDGEIEFFQCPRYKASEPETLLGDDGIMRWSPSIFMPRWASRIQLVVKNVRVERVQSISEKDAASEGVIYSAGGQPKEFMERNTPINCFRRLWDSINKQRGYGWDKNPWVWVVEFEVMDNA